MSHAGGDSPELTSLVTYLAFLRNANKDTANRLHSLVKDDSDPLLLTLGSLAEYAPVDVSGGSTTPSACNMHHATCSVQYISI